MNEKTKTGFVVAAYIQPVLKAFLKQGGRLSLLADAMGVNDAWMLEPPEQIAIDQYFSLLLHASQLLNDGHLGIRIGQYVALANFDVLGQALANTQSRSLTLAQALQQVMILERLVHRLGDSRIQIEDQNVRLIWRAQYPQSKSSRLVVESVLAGMIHLAQQLMGRLIPIREMTFIHGKPHDYRADVYQQGFHTQCFFGQKDNSLVIASEVLEWPLKETDKLQSQALSTDTIVDQVKHHLEQTIMHNPKLLQIAAMLGMSERTLQRKLKAQGVSFQQILSDVRHQLACDYLQFSNLTILQISQFLGFKEQSSFNHFFLQVVGVSPREYRLQPV